MINIRCHTQKNNVAELTTILTKSVPNDDTHNPLFCSAFSKSFINRLGIRTIGYDPEMRD